MIKTAVIGASGYIGRHLLDKYREQFPQCVGTSYSDRVPHLIPFDIREPDFEFSCDLESTGHEAAVIASAIPNISYCENQPVDAYEVNVAGTLKLLMNLSETSLRIIFLSTDYVFDGVQGNFDDNHRTNPSTNYGKHKETIERAITELTDNFLVIRLSKIYGLRKGDNTILDEAASLLHNNAQVFGASDQYFCPTYIGDIVQAIIDVQEENLAGIINICSPEIWSRFEMYTKLAQLMDKDKSLVKEINLYDWPEMRGRPLNTSMVCSRLHQETRTEFVCLEESIDKVARNY